MNNAATAQTQELTEGGIRSLIRECPVGSNVLDFLKDEGVIQEKVPTMIFARLGWTEKLFVLQDGTIW